MAGNITPIFSRQADIQGQTLLLNPVAATSTAGASGYAGFDANAYCVFTADPVNGGYIQRLRFKANGTNPADVVRVWICNANGQLQTTTTAPQTPTATISGTAGTMTPGTYYMKVQALDAFGQPGAFSTEISNTVPATGNNIVWGWSAPVTATQGVSTYRLVLGLATNQEQLFIANVSGLTYTQNTAFWSGMLGNQYAEFCGPMSNSTATYTSDLTINTTFIGELSLPVTTAITTAGTVDIDYTMNMAIPPGYRIVVGLGTATANGWYCSAIAGKY